MMSKLKISDHNGYAPRFNLAKLLALKKGLKYVKAEKDTLDAGTNENKPKPKRSLTRSKGKSNSSNTLRDSKIPASKRKLLRRRTVSKTASKRSTSKRK